MTDYDVRIDFNEIKHDYKQSNIIYKMALFGWGEVSLGKETSRIMIRMWEIIFNVRMICLTETA